MRGIRLSIKLPVLIVLSVLLMALGGSLLAIFLGRSTLRTREQGHNVEAANAYASAVNSYLDNARSILETTASLSEIKDFATIRFINPALHGIPASVDKPKHKVAGLVLKYSEIFEYVMLLQAEGSVYMLEPYDLQIKLSHHNLAFTDWYKKLMSTGKTVISDLHISPVTQRPTVVIATPVRSSAGKIIGIWTGALKLEELSETGRGGLENETPLHYGYVTDNRGLVIAHQANLKYVQEQTDFGSVPPVRAALSGQRGATQFIDPIEREEKLGAYLPLSGSGWAVVYVVPTTIAFAPMNELARNIILIAAGLAALLGFVSWIIVRQIVRPLGQLTAAAATIGTGNFTQRIELRTDDEIGRLSEEFNRMAASLSDKEAQLRDYAAQLEQKVEERTVELTRSNADLAQFAYVASHDLQEPLRMVSSFMQLIEQRYKDKLDAAGTEFINYAVDGANRMQTMINDLLIFSRVGTRGKPFEPIDCEVILDQTLTNLQMAIEDSQAIITRDPLPTVMADDTQMVQLFQNLIGNAIKFRRQEQLRVHISAQAKEEEWVFSVRDNGTGIDPQYAERIFVIFQRLHSKEEYPGTGIGLAVCKRVVERHGGKIWVESQPGQGSTFYFTIPKRGGK